VRIKPGGDLFKEASEAGAKVCLYPCTMTVKLTIGAIKDNLSEAQKQELLSRTKKNTLFAAGFI